MNSAFKKSALVTLIYLLGITPSWAAFTLNFGGHPNRVAGHWADTNCNRGEGAIQGADSNNPCGHGFASSDVDDTPFLSESLSNGYYHMVIGAEADGFVQEYYIKYSGFGGAPQSYSEGSGCYNSFSCQPVTNLQQTSGNGWDPLRYNDKTFTGIGSGNPNNVIMKQLLTDSEIDQSFVKGDGDVFTTKPKITQDVVTANINSHVVIDMSSLNYSTSGTAGAFTNTFSLPGALTVVPTFDYAIDAQNPFLTAGRYTYTNSSGNGSSNGTYNYWDGGVNIDLLTWKNYRDTSQNFSGPGNIGK